MTKGSEQLKQLLRAAEQQISQLTDEVGHYQALQNDMMTAQQAMDEQLVAMTEQVWSLEEALQETAQDNAAALKLIKRLRKNMAAVQKQMHDTLEAAKANASRIEMAARVYEMASMPNVAEDDALARQYEEHVRRLRDKVGR